MAKKAKGFGVDDYKKKKKKKRKGRVSKSPNKSKKLSFKKYNGQGKPS